MPSHLRGFIVLVVLVAWPPGSGAQSLPTGPLRALDGGLLVSGEVVGTMSSSDDEGTYFNYTDYSHDALRLFRVGLSAAWRPARRLAFVGELRTENLDRPRAYAAYVRFRPWTDRGLHFQAGRIPPAFGVFSRHAYSSDNTVIGYPLAYQYLTSIRPDAVPATADDLIRMRTRGWRSEFPVGSGTARPGVPLTTAFRWDTGVQAHWQAGIVEGTLALTAGTLSDPHVADNNGSPQVSGRFATRPSAGLIVGASGARGAWLSSDVRRLLPAVDARFTQAAWGADAEYSRDHWLVRSEMIWSRWRVPFAVAAPAGAELDALAVWLEGRYKLTPRITAGFRADHLGFSRIAAGGTWTPWESPMNRVEAAVGYALQRNLTARIAVQRNDRDAGRVRARTYISGQLAFWF